MVNRSQCRIPLYTKMHNSLFMCFGILFSTVISVINTLDMSEHIVFKPGSTLTLYCWFKDSNPPAEIEFIWHHNRTRLELTDSKPNLPDKDYENFIYKLSRYNAGINASGSYSCNIHDRPEVVSTTVTSVIVDESPVVAEMLKRASFNILDPSQSRDNIQCFTAVDNPTEIPDCVYNIQSVEDSDIGNHNTVIASSRSIQHYRTIQNAIDHEVTFNASKQLLGLHIQKVAENISCTLHGTGGALRDSKVACLDKQNNVIEVLEIDSEAEDQRVFICNRPGAKAEITVRISVKDLVIFDKTVKDSAAIRPGFNYLFIPFLFILHIAFVD